MAVEYVIPVWKTIELGTSLKTADDFRRALREGGFKIGDWGNGIHGKPAFTAATNETEVDLARVTVSELGFKEGARRGQIYERAKQLGLELCSSEVGPQLRLQYKDQPRGEWLLIGMEPILASDGYPNIFCVRHGGSELWLYGCFGFPAYLWNAGSQWVFVRPRK
jgi:hypothetical protein